MRVEKEVGTRSSVSLRSRQGEKKSSSSTYHICPSPSSVGERLPTRTLLIMAPVTDRAAQNAERGASSFSRWVDANRNLAIALGLGTIAVGGAGVYYYLNGSPRSSRGKGENEGADLGGERGTAGGSSSAAAKKKKSKKSKKTKDGSNTADSHLAGEGPLLDEASDQDLMALSEEEIVRLPEEVSRWAERNSV